MVLKHIYLSVIYYKNVHIKERKNQKQIYGSLAIIANQTKINVNAYVRLIADYYEHSNVDT